MQITPNFSTDEFKCPCCKGADMNILFVETLQKIRDEYGRPMPVVSGWRCGVRNAEVGGKANSRHLSGNAADIRVATTEDRYHLVALAMKHGLRGIGINRTTVHLDARSTGVRMWTYY
jgi:uncharacterized protein YcbK (DUF882 family)